MNSTVEKRVQMDEERAGKLKRLAMSQNTTPDALIANICGMLFLAEPELVGIAPELKADWELLEKLEAESSASLIDSADILHAIRSPSRFDLTQGNVTHVIPVPPDKLRRLGEDR